MAKYEVERRVRRPSSLYVTDMRPVQGPSPFEIVSEGSYDPESDTLQFSVSDYGDGRTWDPIFRVWTWSSEDLAARELSRLAR